MQRAKTSYFCLSRPKAAWGIRMKKRWQTVLSVLLYIFIVACALDFNIFLLIDMRLIFLTLVGTLLLTLPYYEGKISRRELLYIFGRKSIDTGFIQTFLLLFARLQNEAGYSRLLGDIALCFRPLLYGFCLFLLLAERLETQSTKNPDGTGLSGVQADTAGSDTMQASANQKNVSSEFASQAASETEAAGLGSAVQTASENEASENETSTPQSSAQKKIGVQEFAMTYALTRRETEITQLIIQGKSNAMIAGELFISETTVKKHVSNIFEKTGVSRREELMVRVQAEESI